MKRLWLVAAGIGLALATTLLAGCATGQAVLTCGDPSTGTVCAQGPAEDAGGITECTIVGNGIAICL